MIRGGPSLSQATSTLLLVAMKKTLPEIEKEEQCPRCRGEGVRHYSALEVKEISTTPQEAYNYGILGVCDACWGSGKKHESWDNLRSAHALRSELRKARREMQTLKYWVADLLASIRKKERDGSRERNRTGEQAGQ